MQGGGGQGPQSPGAPPPGGYGVPPRGGPPQNPNPYGPYAPPQQQQQYGGPMSVYTPFCGTCPQCQSTYLTRPTFTWWGGLLGPKLLNHTVCSGCSFAFNGKTGKSNNTAIAIYLGVGAALGVLVVILRIAAG